jgi:hypothetical protein
MKNAASKTIACLNRIMPVDRSMRRGRIEQLRVTNPS